METIQTNVNEAIASFGAIKEKIAEAGVEVPEGTKARELANKVAEVYDKAQGDMWDKYLADKPHTMGMFSGYGWTDETFKPNKDIVLQGYSLYTFYYSRITDLSARLKECGVKLTCGALQSLQACFGYSQITKIPYMDLTGLINYNNVFSNALNLKTIEGVKFAPDVVFNTTFHNCPSLMHIIIDGNIAANGFNVSSSTKLTAASLESIINALSTSTTGLTVTLPSTAEANYDAVKGAGAWDSLVATRSNWTIAYA